MTPETRLKLSGLLGFAEGVLRAREKVQMEMQAGLGVFHEHDFRDAPGVFFDVDDGAWLRVERQRETAPPEPADHLAKFFVAKPKDPTRAPQIRSAISIEATIDEASDLIEAGLLKSVDVRPILEEGIEVEHRVKIILHAENCPEMRRDFERYVGREWSDWAAHEKPIRRTIAIYNSLFAIHSAIHTSEGAPPELVWGIGIGRWKRGTARVDMPILEQLVDIDLEDGGVIVVRPRDLAPSLSLKPYIELDIDGSHTLQRGLQERLSVFMAGNLEFTPFSSSLWEPLLDTVASELSSDGLHISREDLDEGLSLTNASEALRVTSTWAIFGRPRSNEARLGDLKSLRAQIDDDSADVPPSLEGYAATPPNKPSSSADIFGLDLAVLSGDTEAAPAIQSESASFVRGAGTAHASDDGKRKTHFFPLPFNQEQGRISDLIDDPAVSVVCVSGPPGTGKSHSIANIISHQMALGKRVLVTARTPEAIAAVREKLPPSLRTLAIASVGTDRDSAQQLQDAVKELSHEVVSLNTDDALLRWKELDLQIMDCDRIAKETDDRLAQIARANLDQLTWNGKPATPMELVDLLGDAQEAYAWFTDRPSSLSPAQLSDVMDRLKTTLPSLAADIVYAGETLPAADDLPGSAELIAAHTAELKWNSREIVDYSSAPRMARDSANVEDQAGHILIEIETLDGLIAQQSVAVRSLAKHALDETTNIDRADLEATRRYMGKFNYLDRVAQVKFELGACTEADFVSAAKRGASGQKPVGFGFFNSTLKSAVASARFRDAPASTPDDWQAVLEACRLEGEKRHITDALMPFIRDKIMPPMPDRAGEIAGYLSQRLAEVRIALSISDYLDKAISALEPLFPFGLDFTALRQTLNCGPAIFAIRGNLPDGYRPPDPITALREISAGSALPVIVELGNLASAIGNPETTPNDIIDARSEITRELGRLTEVSERLIALGVDLNCLSDAGADEWRCRLAENPADATSLIPEDWREAWEWAVVRARVDQIIALGNGDEQRKVKAEAMKKRRRLFEELIRTRTLIGLKKRMTPSIRQAMEAFTQAVSKIGTGKGKKAPRFIRAARDAARQASSAAPVWIMPEYKIPEQLPADFGDFDLVILDEASQSDITALAALARGKKILVVGDEEQVSPSVVGISMQKINGLRAEFLQDLPNKDLIDENSSIFEITKRMHPESHVLLREHFRCVAPIIQFSTRFYNNELVPLRVPKASERFDPPLADVYIPGATRQGKTNPFEARWIVDEIARLIEDPAHAGRDIGVISLIGGEQADKIGRMLVEDKRIGPEKIEEWRIIYGDARTMQGQERSIVFLSMVATPGHAHSQTSKPDQQRINVAMSRAKDRLYLVRSVQLEDLKPADIKAQILQHFSDPMPGGRPAMGGEVESLLDRCDSGFEREVLQMLIDANYRVRPQVAAGGFKIDLVVEGMEDRRLAIELDGDQYHRDDAWERDMIRQAALERAGWVFWRVFGSQWKANRDFWWRNLCNTLDRLKIEPIGAAAIDDRFTETILVDAAHIDAGAASFEFTEEANEGPESSSNEEPMAATDAAPTDERIKATKTPASDENTKSQAWAVSRKDAQTELDLNSAAPRAAKVTTTDRKYISVGSTVRLEKLGNGGGKLEVTLVSEGHDADNGMLGVHTPLGQALLDAEVGENVEYRAGSYLQEVLILEVM